MATLDEFVAALEAHTAGHLSHMSGHSKGIRFVVSTDAGTRDYLVPRDDIRNAENAATLAEKVAP